MRTILWSSMAFLVGSGVAFGHHGYADYDRNKPVTLEGTIEHVLWANPHVVLTIKTESQGEYSIEWRAISQLWMDGITSVPVKEGDHLIVTGFVNRNPEKRILTLVEEIKRPSDGWHWAKVRNSTPVRR
jgi:hypothetical protein